MSVQQTFLAMLAQNPPPCTDVDPDIFFGGPDVAVSARNTKAAKAVCRTCPLIFACLQFALETNDQFAILGGKTPNERSRAQARYSQQERHAA
jgi:WhiB family redox-sensing transcriptional regulator